MERAKKMVLISKDQLERLQRDAARVLSTTEHSISGHAIVENPDSKTDTLQTVQTTGNNLSRLDDEMKKILDSQTYTNERERLTDYLRVLRRYLYFVEENRKPTGLKDNETSRDLIHGMSDEIIIESVPKLYQKKARLLLNHLKSYKDRINWNASGTVYIDGDKLRHSNIVDLVNDACRHRRKVKAEGRKEFAELLHSIDTPREFVGNNELWSLSHKTFGHRGRRDSNSSDDDDNQDQHNENTPFISSKNSTESFYDTVVGDRGSNKSKKSLRLTSSTPTKKSWMKL